MNDKLNQIKKDFMSYQLVIKRGRNTVFDDEIFLTDSTHAINEALKFALGKSLKRELEHFEIPDLRFDIFPSEQNIEAYGRDNVIILNDKEVYLKELKIDPNYCRYAIKGQTKQFFNNMYPNWKYLNNKFSIYFVLKIDEDGLNKALDNINSYISTERESNVSSYKYKKSEPLLLI